MAESQALIETQRAAESLQEVNSLASQPPMWDAPVCLPIMDDAKVPVSPANLQQPGAQPEKRWVGRSFSRAALGYDRVAALQRQVGEGLLARWQDGRFAHGTLLDLGCGTGYCTSLLAGRFPDAALLALDIAWGMLMAFELRPGLQDKAPRMCADMEALPLRDHSMDVVFSNLALQWCTDLTAAMVEISRVLRPGGMFLFSTFGASTLWELRAAWAKADQHTHVNAFVSLGAIEAALQQAGYADGSVISEQRVVHYVSVAALLRELKNLGAHNVTLARPRHLTGKGTLRKMMEAYAAAMSPGPIAASFEIIYGQARLPSLGGD
jgi:malonyl-CoA O-methyltransferase